MLDSSSSKVHLMYLLLLADLNNVKNYSWGSVVLASLYRALDHIIDFNQDNIGGCTLLFTVLGVGTPSMHFSTTSTIDR